MATWEFVEWEEGLDGVSMYLGDDNHCDMSVSAYIVQKWDGKYSYHAAISEKILSNHARMDTRHEAQRAALAALITQLDAWKTQAEAALVALDEATQ